MQWAFNKYNTKLGEHFINARLATDHCMAQVELHVDNTPELGRSAVCSELKTNSVIGITGILYVY